MFLLQNFQSDKNPLRTPPVGKYFLIKTITKSIFLTKDLLPVYRCCSFVGLTSRQQEYCFCTRCDRFLQHFNQNLTDLRHSHLREANPQEGDQCNVSAVQIEVI